MKDKYIGKVGTQGPDENEYELRTDILGKMIKTARQERNLIQKGPGRLVGVQKVQISKLDIQPFLFFGPIFLLAELLISKLLRAFYCSLPISRNSAKKSYFLGSHEIMF